MRDDVESQNLLLNSVDDRVSSVRTGLSGIVGNFKQVMHSKDGKKNIGITLGITLCLLLLLWLLT